MTAAERFFGQKPRSMFAAILGAVEIPPSPSVRCDLPWARMKGSREAGAVIKTAVFVRPLPDSYLRLQIIGRHLLCGDLRKFQYDPIHMKRIRSLYEQEIAGADKVLDLLRAGIAAIKPMIWMVMLREFSHPDHDVCSAARVGADLIMIRRAFLPVQPWPPKWLIAVVRAWQSPPICLVQASWREDLHYNYRQ